LRIPRILISGPHRSSGKTTLSTGLCRALRDAGLKVQPFKKGPDFIDPMWLSAAAGNDCRNLDLFMMGEDNILDSFRRAASGAVAEGGGGKSGPADIGIIEGNMGLYDSLEVDGRGSSSDMARLLGAPVVLIVDTRSMNRSIAPLLMGFQQFEPDISIAGVVLNKVFGPRHERKLRAAIAEYTDIEVVGSIPRRSEMGIIMRHLGLEPAREHLAAESVIEAMGGAITGYVDLERIREIAAMAPPIAGGVQAAATPPEPRVRLGLARDRAFTFYYPENLEALRMAGAELVPFSPMDDGELPSVDGLFIGGGFPEVFMEELEANSSMRRQIREAAAAGMPVYAECGGLMYLSRRMTWKGGSREMVGALPCDVLMHEKPQGHGYMELEATGEGGWFDAGARVRGHEFHYSQITGLEGAGGDSRRRGGSGAGFAWKVIRGTGVDGRHDGILHGNILASYAHLHSLGSPRWAERLVSFIGQS
jgi:cobyrinic acid a,c-diamide synthase